MVVMVRFGRLMTGILAVASLAVAVAACGGDDEQAFTGLRRDPPLSGAGFTLPEVDPEGTATPFELRAAEGELLAVYFGYTACPDICPTTMSDLRSMKQELGDDGDRIAVAMVTVDPERDTPERLNAYLGSYFDRFHALRTTDEAELQRAKDAFLAQSSITPKEDGEGYDVAHSATVYLVDDTGTVLVEWPFGTPWRAMAADTRAVLDELGGPS